MAAYCLNAVVSPDRFDLLIAQWQELGMLGCEEQSSAEGVLANVYFKDAASAQKAAQTLTETGQAKNISVETIEDRDWNAKWRETMKPARLAAGWWVSPLWLTPPKSAKHWIKIEPKMAFGTGHHETTRLAAQAIIAQKRRIKNKRVLDIGTGSGVLCFVAALCGARFCLGVEIDADCRENLAENLRNNKPAGKIDFLIGSPDGLKGHNLFDLVVMNMLLIESAPLLDSASALLVPGGMPGGTLIWSGLLTGERHEAVESARKFNLALVSEKRENEWWCGTFRTIKR